MHKSKSSALWIAGLLPGLLVAGVGLIIPELRRPDGHFLPQAWTVVIGGLALALIGYGIGTRWQQFLGLLSLYLFGNAAALAIINAPSYDAIQHYLTWSELLQTDKGLLLIAPFLQTILMCVAFYRARTKVIQWIRETITVPVVVLLFGIVVLTAAYPTWNLKLYLGEELLACWIILVNLSNLVIAVAAVPRSSLKQWSDWIESAFSTRSEDKSADHWLPWMLAGWVTIVSATLSWLVFERIPHIPDDVGYLFQAKYLALGKLYLPAPPDISAFALDKLYTDGVKWWNYGFPGWPAVLALGVRVGAAWLVNPILAGFSIFLAWHVLNRMYDRTMAYAVSGLMAFSPWLLFMSASFMPHPLSLVWMLIALYGIQKVREVHRAPWALLSGAALGGLLLNRPLEAIAVGLAIGIWILFTFENRGLLVRSCLGIALGGICVGGLIFPYNHALTGKFLYTPQQQYTNSLYGGRDRLGFGPDIGNIGWTSLDPIPGHGPIDVLINSAQNFYNSGFELYGWAFGSFVFAATFVLWRRYRNPDFIFLLIPLLVIAAHSFYWFSGGPDFGARYWYQILVPLTVLTVRGIQELQKRWVRNEQSPLTTARLSAFVFLACAVAFLNFIPWRGLGKYYRYRGMSADIQRLAAECSFGHSLVFVENKEKEDYAAAFIFNPASLDSSGPIYVRYQGMENVPRVAQKFPDRTIWIVEGSEANHQPLRARAGSGTNSKPASSCAAVQTQPDAHSTRAF